MSHEVPVNLRSDSGIWPPFNSSTLGEIAPPLSLRKPVSEILCPDGRVPALYFFELSNLRILVL